MLRQRIQEWHDEVKANIAACTYGHCIKCTLERESMLTLETVLNIIDEETATYTSAR